MKKVALLVFLIPYLLMGQVSVKDSSVAIPLVSASYGMQFASGDLAHRFGIHSSVGVEFCYKTKNNFLFGLNWNFLFGNKVKENTILDSLLTSDGFILTASGELGEIRLFQRGFRSAVSIGKIFPVLSSNPNSGILGSVELGYLQHKIRIDDQRQSSPQINSEYVKGYDRLTGGLSLTGFVGYQIMGNSRMLNFKLGLEATTAFTQSLRSFDYDLGRRDTQKRKDITYGIKASWILPLYKKVPEEFYYY